MKKENDGYYKTEYSRPEKDRVRDEIIKDFTNPRILNDEYPIITLETAQWLFVKEFDEEQLFIIYQIDNREYKLQRKNQPKNVCVELSNCNKIDYPIKYAYFDYCQHWLTNKDFVKRLFDDRLLVHNGILAFTCSKRSGKVLNDNQRANPQVIRYNLRYWAKKNGYSLPKIKTYEYRDFPHQAMITIVCHIKKVK